MGYLSQVAVVIKTVDNNKFTEAINDWDKKYNLDGYRSAKYLLKNADKDRESKDGEYRIISWNDIKWYSGIKGFENVDFFENLDEYDVQYDFVRIGEDMGDYECSGDLDSGLVYPDQSLWFNKELI